MATRTKRKPPAPPLSPEQVSEVQRGLRRTWERIAPDYMELEEGGSIPKSQVVEVTLDADYLETHGDLLAELLEAFRAQSYEEQQRIAAAAWRWERTS